MRTRLSLGVLWSLVGVPAALSLGTVIQGNSVGLAHWWWAGLGEGLVSLAFRKPKILARLTLRHVNFKVWASEMLRLSAEHVCGCIWAASGVPQCTLTPQPLSSRRHAAIRWCHNQPWPWPCASVSPLGEGRALVSTRLSARSRCRRRWDLQLDVQTPKCSGVTVTTAVSVSPSGKEPWSESGRITPLSWPDGRTGGRYLLTLLCFQQEH